MVTFWKRICNHISKVLPFDKVILEFCLKKIIRKTVVIDSDIIIMEKLEIVYKSTIGEWLKRIMVYTYAGH